MWPGEVALPIFAWGGTQVILPSTDPQQILVAISRHRITTVSAAETCLYHPDPAEPPRIRSELAQVRPVRLGSDVRAEAQGGFGPDLLQIADGRSCGDKWCRPRVGSAGRPPPGLKGPVKIQRKGGRRSVPRSQPIRHLL